MADAVRSANRRVSWSRVSARKLLNWAAVEDAKNKREASFSGPVTFVTFGSAQYVWINDGPNSHADPDNPPVATTIKGEPGTGYTLPKASVTVLRGKVGALRD